MAGRDDGDLHTDVLPRGGSGIALRTRVIRIEVVAGPQAGQVFDLPGPEVRVGSGRGNDLLLLDSAVSRHHLTIQASRRALRVLDAGSRNGTLVDGTSIRDADARPDSLIVLGATTLRLRQLDDVVELPLSSRERFGGLLGRSVALRRVFTLLERVAPTDDTVLVEGETGTGKELVAEALHEESPRASGPFVVFDCSAVAPTLVESELFGHVRGAFSGAVSDRAGAFEAADGGTLFLDELGELPLELQPKLLRALERLEIRRVGSTAVRRVDVRIVAATNRSLEQEVAAGRFREDLYYRLAVVRVTLPPLRARRDDIPLLVEHFARQLSPRGRATTVVPERTVQAFQGQAWPGNVRELRNAVRRALSLGGPSGPGATPPEAHAEPAAAIDLSVPLKVARERMLERFEAAYIREALRETGGNITHAARIAGVNRKLVQRVIAQHDLRANAGPDDDER